MADISEYLGQLQSLTQKNLEILKAINDSFFTKKEHLRVEVGEASYVVPSFISLENKINSLQENFDNLVYAPKTGEATFNIDGNSRRIEVKGYTCTPNRITLNVNDIDGFSVEQNDIFKDFLTPNPFVHLNLQTIPNDIVTVNVRKVVAKSDELKGVLKSRLSNDEALIGIEWSDLYKILSIYKEDIDYVMYDTMRQLPIRTNIGSGVYTIKSIDSDDVDADELKEHLTITLHEDLKYKLYDETIERYIEVGDDLITFDDSAKLRVEYVNAAARQIKVVVENGDYLNLLEDPEGGLSSDMCKLKYFSKVDYDKDKYINVPLEEDRFVCIFVAPLNNRMNIQAPWGGGIMIDTNEIRLASDGKTRFLDYYEENIRNVGDILYELSAAMTTSIMKYSEADYNLFTQYLPVIDPNCLKVVQINSHINNSPTVKNIRSMHAQKQELNRQLVELNEQIANINNTLVEVSYADTTGVRSAYEAQLDQYNIKRNTILSSLSKLTDNINTAVNDSAIPLENAKYRIRGYYNWCIKNEDNDPVLAKFWKHVHGIKVQYRYKNQDSEVGSAVSIDDNFVFSDWNDMSSTILNKVASYNGGYKFNYPQHTSSNGVSHDNGMLNEPSFNQIDIPITQGETVDIRLKVIWDFGFPFVETTSAWSSIVNIEFPTEYLKDVQLSDIILENSNDYEKNILRNMMIEQGLDKHAADKVTDQDLIYFHQPDHIASGFYTNERRIVPLKEKLQDFNRDIAELKDLINGTFNSCIDVVMNIDGNETSVKTGKINTFSLPAYSTTDAYNNEVDGGIKSIPAVVQATIQLTNNSDHTAYIYSMFPAISSLALNQLKPSKFKVADYCNVSNDNEGVVLGWQSVDSNQNNSTSFGLQTANQWLTFRINDLYTGTYFYDNSSSINNTFNPLTIDQLRSQIADLEKVDSVGGMVVYPYLADENTLKIQGESLYDKVTLGPGESILVPIMIHYMFTSQDSNKQYNKTISFDIRTSLYEEPKNYIIKFVANNYDTIQERIAKAERSRLIDKSRSAGSTKYSTLIKN